MLSGKPGQLLVNGDKDRGLQRKLQQKHEECGMRSVVPAKGTQLIQKTKRGAVIGKNPKFEGSNIRPGTKG